MRQLAKAFGFKRIGPHIREVLAGDLLAAVRRYILYRDGDRLYLDCRHISYYPRARLRNALVSAIGYTWTEQSEAIRQAAHYLGFRRAGPAIHQAFISAINGAIRQGLLERDGRHLRAVR
jgi:hypothetical protein